MIKTKRRGTGWGAGSVLLLIGLATSCATHSASGGVRGRVVSSITGTAPKSSYPIFVTATPERRSARGPATYTLVRSKGRFSRPFLVVPLGGSVRFVNREEICHGFFSSAKQAAFDLGTLDPGAGATVRLPRPGLLHVYCSLHSGEKATILVAPSPYYATVDSEGAFELAGLPPGPCILETWSEDLPQQRVEVTVPKAGSTFAELPLGAARARGSG